MKDMFPNVSIHSIGNSGEHLIGVSKSHKIERRSNFPTEFLPQVSSLMRDVTTMATPDGKGKSFLGDQIVKEFQIAAQTPEATYFEFPHLVYSAVLNTFDAAVLDKKTNQPDPLMQEVLVWMLLNAGAEGIGALTHLTANYLEVALHNKLHPDELREFRDIDDSMFEKGHRREVRKDELWHENEVDDASLEEAVANGDIDGLFYIVCLGKRFVRASQSSIRLAAEKIVRQKRFNDVLARVPEIIGPGEEINLFINRYQFLGMVNDYALSLADELGIREKVENPISLDPLND